MARVTVEDCIDKFSNRFDLVLMAAQRVRQIISGSALTVSRDDDKNTVVALREIAEGKADLETLLDELIRGKQKFTESEDFDEETLDLMESEAGWIGAGSSEKPMEVPMFEGEDVDDEMPSDVVLEASVEEDEEEPVG